MSRQSPNNGEPHRFRRATSPSVASGQAARDDAVPQSPLIAIAENRIEEERAKLARSKELFERQYALLEELAELRRERIRAERKVRSLKKRVEREQRQPELFVASGDGSRRGRPVRIEVDAEAWAVVKREAVRRKLWLVSWVGEWICVEVESLDAGDVSGRPSTRRRRSPGEDDPRPRQRFLRIDIDDEKWNAFRAFALDLGLTVGRYVGQLAESTAYESGWRSGSLPKG